MRVYKVITNHLLLFLLIISLSRLISSALFCQLFNSFVWLGPHSTVGFACAHEWLRAAWVASVKPGIVP